MSVEFWKSFFDWGTVVLIGLTFVFGAGALITGNIIADQKDRELAEERRKTAEAQAKTAEAQLALRKAAEYASTPRRIVMGARITNEQNDQELRAAKFKALEKYAETPAVIVFVRNSDDAEQLAYDIRNALAKAGWRSILVSELSATPIPLGYVQEGVQVRTIFKADNPPVRMSPPPGAKPPDVALAILGLLGLDLGPPVGSPRGVFWEPDTIINGKPFAGLSRYGFQFPEGGVVITVGRKPTEYLFWGIPDLPSVKK